MLKLGIQACLASQSQLRSANRGHWTPAWLEVKGLLAFFNDLLLLLFLHLCRDGSFPKPAAEVGVWSLQQLQNQLHNSPKMQCVHCPLFSWSQCSPTGSLTRLRATDPGPASSPFIFFMPTILHLLSAQGGCGAPHNSCLSSTVICYSVCQAHN